MKTVVLGFLGTTLDQGRTEQRWDRWRPTVALCQQDDLVVDRLELLHDRKHAALAKTVVDDIARVSPETTVRLVEMSIADPWDLEEVYGTLHDFARAYPWKPDKERYLVHITTGTHVAQICLFLLTESRHLPAQLLQTAPSGRTHTTIDLDLSRYDRLASRFLAERREGISLLKSGIETRNAKFNRLIERMEKVALVSRAPLLLTGPTGAGKSQLARRVYAMKRARQKLGGELVEVNCATLRGDGAMSALFGHKKGSFTGATHDRVGLLKKADGGVLFLDEVGELGLDEQAMLLHALEEKRFLPIGDDRETHSDFQLLAGTNRELRTLVGQGRFREDLLARINLWTFELPGLAERPEDIEPNLDYELDSAARALGQRVSFNKTARATFVEFATSSPWPGNFRDFGGAVLRMATLAPGGRIDDQTVADELVRLRSAWGDAQDEVERLLGRRARTLDRFERVQLADVLRVCGGAASLSAAGRALFASSRAQKSSSNDADRLRKYLARYGLDWSAVK